jgi:hypothetical protein
VRAFRVVWTFLVDLIIGDDPKVAVAVVGSLVAAAVALEFGVADSVVAVGGALLVMLAFTVCLLLDASRSRRVDG